MSETHPLMPDFEHSSYGFHHTLDSALAILSDMDVPPGRVTVRMDGRGYPTRWVVSQSPAPGQPLDSGTTVEILIAGTGYFHALPVGMWDSGGEAEPGTREIVELLDDPIQKATHWVWEGARLFDVRPDNLPACSRWISLFGLSPDDWPSETWYNLCVLLPSLQALAGTEYGLRFALHLILGLPLKEIRRSTTFQLMKEPEYTLLGQRYSRLGVDAIAGERKEELEELTLVLGLVSLDTYYEFQEKEKQRLLLAVLGLVANCYQKHGIAWAVGNPRIMPRLSQARQNTILGINSYLGSSARSADAEPELFFQGTVH
ncbi:MAG TPA: PASTA domain-containing protein [Bryobacteraceae bacterium]|nr:PASTA domain-containing protein [Bryobacteraceae bacterium]